MNSLPDVSPYYIPVHLNEGHTVKHSFPTTRWTLVAQASASEPRERDAALEELCQSYWPPVYAYLRSKGVLPAEAEDLTQGFFAEFLSRDNFTKVDESRGRLRSYLLSAASNFMTQDYRNRTRQKRGGGTQILSLNFTNRDGANRILEIEDHETPEALFERQWAVTVLQQVLESVEVHYENSGQTSLFNALRFVISPNDEKRSHEEVAKQEGMSVSAVKSAAYRLRERFARELRATIADTLLDHQDVDDEIRELMAVFR